MSLCHVICISIVSHVLGCHKHVLNSFVSGDWVWTVVSAGLQFFDVSLHHKYIKYKIYIGGTKISEGGNAYMVT